MGDTYWCDCDNGQYDTWDEIHGAQTHNCTRCGGKGFLTESEMHRPPRLSIDDPEAAKRSREAHSKSMDAAIKAVEAFSIKLQREGKERKARLDRLVRRIPGKTDPDKKD